MTTTHECGHLLGGWIGGGTLRHAELRPWRLPHSHFAPDPRPLVTLWSGPLFGVIAPVALAAIIRRRETWFIADFCVLANGCYLALAWVSGDRFLDTPRLLAAGANPITIVLYCGSTIAVGYVRFRASCRRLWDRRVHVG